MKTGSIIGIILAIVCIVGGAWWINDQEGGGALPLNIFTTYNVDAEFFNGSAIFIVNASKENVTIEGLEIYTSYDAGDTFAKSTDLENITLPETINISMNENETELTYYVIIKDGLESVRLPKTVDTFYTLDITAIAIEDVNETEEPATITFSTSADFSNITNITVITLSADSEINETIQANLFTSFDNITFENVENKTASILPLTFDVEKTTEDTSLYYYMDVIFENVSTQIPNSVAVVALE